MLYASGILPVSRLPDGRVVFLIGKDVRDGTWSDFGGKVERGDRGCPMNTAAREFYEESLGCVASAWGVRQRMVPGNCVALKSVTQNGHVYWMYLVEVPYFPHVRKTFAKVLAFLGYKDLDAQLVEKTDVTWVDLGALEKIQKRHVFRATIEAHAVTLARVACEPWKDVCAAGDPEGLSKKYSV
jgi:8-oxo-dGTP pyrophosphatase MutT (NUDIX family)